MITTDEIKFEIQKLFHANTIIHLDVSMDRLKTRISNQEAKIKNVYPNIFQVETQGKCYTFQYTDILTKNIEIAEIEECPFI